MPFYGYICEECKKQTEVLLLSIPKVEKPPICCGKPMKRTISKNVGDVYKGSGFYINDYGRKSPERKAT